MPLCALYTHSLPGARSSFPFPTYHPSEGTGSLSPHPHFGSCGPRQHSACVANRTFLPLKVAFAITPQTSGRRHVGGLVVFRLRRCGRFRGLVFRLRLVATRG